MSAVEIAAFLGTEDRPPHDQDQLAMYRDLVYAAPGLTDASLRDFFKDATFGVKPEDVEREYSPRGDVTIVRDSFGVPRIYGETRPGAMFGAGYVAAEDRMFLIDALRHAGRAQLASFAGGSEGNLEMDRGVWADTPYRSDAELELQFELGDDLYGAEGAQVQEDVTNFVAGINKRISEIRSNPMLMPGEYQLLGHPQGPEDWKVADVIATASLVAGIFGKGGGNELGSARVLEEAKERFGARAGFRVWRDFRRAEDPEAPVTVRGKRFPYEVVPRKVKGRALPDRDTLKLSEVLVSSTAPPPSERAAPADELPDIGDLLGNLRSLEGGSSAVLISARESESGRPLAVMGPQVSYFTPQILMEEEIHAPGGPSGPPIDARGTAFPGTNLYVQLGHGRDYAWSATSAGQDIIDTFALRLCEPDGSRASLASMHYRYRGQCLPIDVLEQVNSWTQSVGDMTASGTETYRAERTALGIVAARARIGGKPYAFTRLRATYFHEVDSALGFADFNNPERMESPQEFMAAACRIDFTFNWFFINPQHVAYFNSGVNPRRGRHVDPNFPVLGRKQFEWRGYVPPTQALLGGSTPDASEIDPRTALSKRLPCKAHPQTIDQSWITSWNNKQARGYRAADDQFAFGPVFRSTRLDERVRARVKGPRKISLRELVDYGMEEAGTADLRGDVVVPLALKVIGSGKVKKSPEVRAALRSLRAWRDSGSHRRDLDRDGTYDHTNAVRIIDAWWPRWVKAQFRPKLGNGLFDAIEEMIGLHDAPGPVGSAFISGWYGYVDKDLRSILGQRVKGRFSREYCGGGRLAKCRRLLVRSLAAALEHDSDAELYPGQPDGDCEGLGDAQWCNDAVRHTAIGAITQPPMPWIDRPTFQQVIEVGR